MANGAESSPLPSVSTVRETVLREMATSDSIENTPAVVLASTSVSRSDTVEISAATPGAWLLPERDRCCRATLGPSACSMPGSISTDGMSPAPVSTVVPRPAPVSTSDFWICTDSAYVPAARDTVSPAVASPIAYWIVLHGVAATVQSLGPLPSTLSAPAGET